MGKNTELNLDELEAVTGGIEGRPVDPERIICRYASIYNGGSRKPDEIKEIDGGYRGTCYLVTNSRCNPYSCKCHGTNHCIDGWHICDRFGEAFPGH